MAEDLNAAQTESCVTQSKNQTQEDFAMTPTEKYHQKKRGMMAVNDKDMTINQANVTRSTMIIECGNCCKRISNIDWYNYGLFETTVVLVPPPGDKCLLVETICNGKIVEKQLVSTIAVPVSNICNTFA